MGITITIATDKALVHLRRAFHSCAEVDRRFLTASYKLRGDADKDGVDDRGAGDRRNRAYL
jgi:hypothetical protein